MIRQDLDEEDLRTEIYNLRKHISRVCGENNILKVKIRKLHDEMCKRDKQLDTFLDPRRFLNISKTLQDKGASVLLNLKLKNDKLEQLLLEKDLTIKRLQNTLATAKLYNANSINNNKKSGVKKNDVIEQNNKLNLHLPHFTLTESLSGANSERNLMDVDISERNASDRYGEPLVAMESHICLDISLDLKQKINSIENLDPSCESTTQSSDKKCKSEGTTIQKELIQPPTDCVGTEPMESPTGHDINFDTENIFNPAFRKILQTVESLIARGPTSREKNISVDQCMQYPLEETPPEPPQVHEEQTVLNEQCEVPKDKEIKIYRSAETLTETKVSEIGTATSSTELNADPQPHEEIKQLHVYLMDMILQVDNLKDTITQMKVEQEKTETSLKYKDENIEKLAKQIKELRDYPKVQATEIVSDKKTVETIYQQKDDNLKKNPSKAKIYKENKSIELTQSAPIRKKPLSSHYRSKKTDKEKGERSQRKSKTAEKNCRQNKEIQLVDGNPFFKNNLGNFSLFPKTYNPFSIKNEPLPLENEID